MPINILERILIKMVIFLILAIRIVTFKQLK